MTQPKGRYMTRGEKDGIRREALALVERLGHRIADQSHTLYLRVGAKGHDPEYFLELFQRELRRWVNSYQMVYKEPKAKKVAKGRSV